MVGGNSKIQEFLRSMETTELKTAVSLAELIRRPELSYEAIAPIDLDTKTAAGRCHRAD